MIKQTIMDIFGDLEYLNDLNYMLKEGLLECDNYIKIKSDIEDCLKLVTSKDKWKLLCDLQLDSNQLEDYFDSVTYEERVNYFKFGIGCLLYFIQANFTGPALPRTLTDLFKDEMFKKIELEKRLAVNNEDINVNTTYPILLLGAQLIFRSCFVHNLVNMWWTFRVAKIHQEVLDELSPTLLLVGDRFCKELDNFIIEGHTRAKLDIELAQFFLTYKSIAKAKKFLNSAIDILGVEMEVTGKLGKRTKYQEKEIAQLVVQVNLNEKDNIERPEVPDMSTPKNLTLKDDVRLNEIQFSQSPTVARLPNTEQQLLLTIFKDKLAATPPDELQYEELQPYTELVLNQKNIYAVKVAALLLRSKLESKNKRTIERSMKQCEEIIEFFKKGDANTAYERYAGIFQTEFPPIWKIETELAGILLNLGLIQNSLDVFIKVKLWEEVIVCYTILQRRHKAAEIIREQLEKNPSVKMMCLLGDATDDVTCYEKAWEMSKRRSHRVQRHWAQYLFEHKQYKECIPHYEKSLSINPLQSKLWLRLGYAALETENWQTAATAYRRYTSLEPDGFEAWNNLAQAYIKLGNKRSAHYALLEALKHNYDSWKVWENLLVVSCDINSVFDVIRAYNRILDLKHKYYNIDVLTMLVFACEKHKGDAQAHSTLIKKTQELFGRITSIYTNDGYIWKLYAHVAADTVSQLHLLTRAYRSFTQTGWDKNPETVVQTLVVCLKLAEIVLSNEFDSRNSMLNSVRLNLNSALAALKKQNCDDVRSMVEQVYEYCEKIVDKIKMADNK